jgi:hypothetical protein
MKNYFLILCIAAFPKVLQAQFIDSAKLNLTTNPSSIEVYGLFGDTGWSITNIEHLVTDTVFVTMHFKECYGFQAVEPFDTIFSYTDLPTVPTVLRVYALRDTNTVDSISCYIHNSLDTIGVYTIGISYASLDETNKQNKLIIFPNPTQDFFNIEGIKENEINRISLLDLSGRLIRTFNTDELRFNVSGIDKGKYFLYLETTFQAHYQSVQIE